MVSHADGRNLRAVEQLEDVHANKHLRDYDEDIALRDKLGASKRGVEGRVDERNIDERIRGHDQDEDLGRTGDMVIDESPACRLVH